MQADIIDEKSFDAQYTECLGPALAAHIWYTHIYIHWEYTTGTSYSYIFKKQAQNPTLFTGSDQDSEVGQLLL